MAMLLAGCGSPVPGRDGPVAEHPEPTSTVPPTTTAIPTTTRVDTGDLVDPDLRRVEVDGQELLVAWADDRHERARGLMEVEELGDLDGMLFDLGSERSVSFTMRNTLIALDIYFFDSGGAGVGMRDMVPCEAEPCPSYSIDSPARYALEVPAGTLEVGDTPELTVP